MHDLYYDPDKFGLATVGEIEWSGGGYEFDLTVVWRRTADSQLLTGDDSGCSCPSPFESTGIGDLTPVTPAELQVMLDKRNAERDNWMPDCSAQIADLMLKVTNADVG